MREPGDDADDVERDDDGEELVPIWKVLAAIRLGLYGSEPVVEQLGSHWERHCFAHAEWWREMRDAWGDIIDTFQWKLLMARIDFANMKRAGIATKQDIERGKWLSDVVETAKEGHAVCQKQITLWVTRAQQGEP